MFIVAWVAKGPYESAANTDHYHRIEDEAEAHALYERVRNDASTWTASLATEIQSTDLL